MANSNYCVTFRIADETINGKTYDDRRQQLLDNINPKGLGYWAEPTSFILVESPLNTTAFATKAVQGLAHKDLVFVLDPTDQSACFFGDVRHEDVLKSFFPKAKRI